MSCVYRSIVFAVGVSLLLPHTECRAALAKTDDLSCHEHGTCANTGSSPTSSSLLQKVFQTERTNLEVNEEGSQIPCTGVVAQGKCWYFSDLGDTCSNTCKKQGRSLDFVVADENDPMTPKLIGHIPAGKQAAWAAYECFVPNEDRYHTANAKAAEHFVGDIGAWSHGECKLACPCDYANITTTNTTTITSTVTPTVTPTVTCEWKQPPACAFTFMWKGVEYSGCPTVDHDKPWCQYHHHHTDKDQNTADDWSYCEYTCSSQNTTYKNDTGCEWNLAPNCLAEFDYEGTRYVGCTLADHDTPWCANSNPYNGSWNNCMYTCPGDKKTTDDDNKPADDDDVLCTWKLKPECSSTFNYKGVDYSACTTEDHPTPWCSQHRVHQGVWSVCERVCVAVVTSPPPTTTTTTITTTTTTTTTAAPASTAMPVTGDEAPCARHPDTENDNLGMSATLDEAGYRMVASAPSPINMKRFICRTSDKLYCRITDFAALMGFIPYYSGDAAADQSFAKLEGELTTLCHRGGTWIEPVAVPTPR